MIFFRLIRAISLLVASLAIVVHMIIPHDHHLVCTEVGVKESCPDTHQNTSNHPVFPAHCHAFNDMAAEKFTPVIQKQDNPKSVALIIWNPDYMVPAVQISQRVFTESGKLVPDIYLHLTAPFRAPPFLS